MKRKPSLPAPETPPPPRARKHLTVTEWRAVLLAARRAGLRAEALVLVLYEAGLRAGEIGKLRVGYLDPKRSRLYVWRSKGSKDGWVDLSKNTLQALLAWMDSCWACPPDSTAFLFPGQPYKGRPATGLCGRMVNVIFKELATTAALHPMLRHPHVLKHSRVQHLLEAITKETGNPWGAVQAIAQLVGHQTAVTTVQNYVAALGTKEQLKVAREATARLTE